MRSSPYLLGGAASAALVAGIVVTIVANDGTGSGSRAMPPSAPPPQTVARLPAAELAATQERTPAPEAQPTPNARAEGAGPVAIPSAFGTLAFPGPGVLLAAVDRPGSPRAVEVRHGHRRRHHPGDSSVVTKRSEPAGTAEPAAWLPPGLAKRPGGLPPGLAKKPGGLPPGLAKRGRGN